jgi:hypothetical protein
MQAIRLADAEDWHNVRMLRLGRRLRFVFEARDMPRILRRGDRQHL